MKKIVAVILSLILLAGMVSGCASSQQKPANAITRAAWIGMLADAYGLDECCSEAPVFSDVPAGSEQFTKIQSCAEWEILDKNKRFYPELTATNAFAVVTSVRAIGLDKIQKTKNAPSLESVQEIENYFVQQSGMTLEMAAALTADVAQKIVDASLDIAAGLVLEQYHNVAYKDNVIEIRENNISIDYENQTASVRDTQIEEGSIVVVQPSSTLPDGLLAQVVSINGSHFSFENAQLEDVFDTLSLYGTYTPEILSVTPLTDGVTVDRGSDTNPAQETLGAYAAPQVQPLGLSGGEPAVESVASVQTKTEDVIAKIDKTLEANGARVNVNGSVGIKDILVTAMLDFSVTSQAASVQVDSTVAADLSVSAKIDKTFKLAEVQCRLWGLVGVDFIVSLHIGLDGAISVDFTVDNCEGVSYHSGRKAKIYAKFQKPELEAQVQLQAAADPSITAELVICTVPVTNVGAEIGLHADAKVLSTEDGLTCSNVDMYVLVSAFVGHTAQNGKETLLAKFNVKKDWDIWTKDNTKMKKSWHIENGQIVPSCTRGTGHSPTTEESTTVPVNTAEAGTLSGKICKASDRESPIGQATISVFYENAPYTSATSDSSGNYNLTLPAGDYRIEITAPGYISFTAYASVTEHNNTYMETFLMVNGSAGENGIASGTISNALTGSGVADVSLSVRNGWNNMQQGSVVMTAKTDAQGNYSLTLPFGNYTVVASKDGFISASINIIVQSGHTDSQNGTISPNISGDDFRIVLTWGATPRDLDSHMQGTLSDGGTFHVYYRDQSQNDGNTEVCNLDVDDTSSYGPETITLHATTNKPYYYYVHRFSNGGTLAASEAQVQVYQGANLVADFNVPTNLGNEVYWNVFAIVDGEIVVKNTITAQADTGYAAS